MNSFRLGFRGSEDLGSGLKAVFQLEAGIAADTGIADTALFKRQANFGLEGNLGRIVVGRSFTTVYDFMIAYDPMGFAPFFSWGPSGNASGANKYGMATAFDNIVKATARLGDLSLGASYGAGEQPGSISDGAKGSVAASYRLGTRSVVTTYKRINGDPVAGTGRRDTTTARHLGAMYSSRPLKLQVVAREYKLAPAAAPTPDVRAILYWAGGSYKLTPVTTLTGVAYYQDVRNVAAGTDTDPLMLVGRVRYAMSKRTDMYLTAVYAKTRNDGLVGLLRDAAGFSERQRGVVAGIQHRF